MTNEGMKKGTNTKDDAEKYLKYLDDETAFQHITVLNLNFDDSDGPNPFSITEQEDGKLRLDDHGADDKHHALCQSDIPGKVQAVVWHRCK